MASNPRGDEQEVPPDPLDQSGVGLPDSGETVEPKSTPSWPEGSQSSVESEERSQSMGGLYLEATQTQGEMMESGEEVEVAKGANKRAAEESAGEGKGSPKRARQEQEEEKEKGEEEEKKESPGSFFDTSEPEEDVQKSQSIVVADVSSKSVVIESPPPRATDDSVIIIDDDSPKEREERKKKNLLLPPLKMPKPTEPDNSLDSTSTSSLGLFTRLRRGSGEDKEQAASSPVVKKDSATHGHDSDRSASYATQTSAGDETGEGEGTVPIPVSAANVDSSANTSANRPADLESPNLSVSPIDPAAALSVAAAARNPQHRSSARVSSTPGRVSPRKRTLKSQAAKAAAAATVSPSSEEEDGKKVHERPRKGRRKTSPSKKKPDNSFKKPLISSTASKDAVGVLLLGSNPEAEDLEKEMRKRFPNVRVIRLKVPLAKGSSSLQAKLAEYVEELSSPEVAAGGAGAKLKRSRLSEGSSTSSMSKSSSTGSSGYVADVSSGGSALSGGSGRDRLSIVPEEPIRPHNVVSPLPKRPPVRVHPEPEESDKGAQEVAPLAVDDDGKEEESLSPVFDTAEVLSKTKTSSPRRKEQETAGAEQHREATVDTSERKDEPERSFKIGTGLRVFAKYVEGRKRVRFWPAEVVEEVDEEGRKFRVKFLEDQVEKELLTEELIPADSLCPGQPVLVLAQGVDKTARLITYPDLSRVRGCTLVAQKPSI